MRNQLDFEMYKVITESLECDESSIVDLKELKKGMTNKSVYFRIKEGNNKGKYIIRIPGIGTNQLINRKQEATVYNTIKGLGICDDPIYLNPDNGYKITKYIEGARICDRSNMEDVKRCIIKLREFHNMNLSVPHSFDIFEQIELYESLRKNRNSQYSEYQEIKKRIQSLRQFISICDGNHCLTHIDSIPDNYIFYTSNEGSEELQLTDWEYSGMQDPHVDIAMFCIYSMYDKAQIDHVINIYFNGKCDLKTRIKIYCYIAMCGLLWSNWCEYKEEFGVKFGEYSLRQYCYAKEYYKYAIELM